MAIRKNITTWLIIAVFLVTSICSTGAAYASDEELPPEARAYRWEISYPKYPDDPEISFTETQIFTFVDADHSAELPCSLMYMDDWSIVQVSGYDHEGAPAVMDLIVSDDGYSAYGEIYMNDEYGDETLYTVYISKTQHEYELVDVREATCEEHGYSEFMCNKCGYVYKEVDPDLASHRWDDTYTIDKKSTYTVAGSKSIYCLECGKKKPNSTVKLPKKTLAAPFVFGASITPDLSKTSGYDDLRVSWEKVKDATGYQVQYRVKGTKKWQNYNSGKWTTKKKIYLKNLKDAKWYQVRVRARVKEDGKFAYSKWEQVLSSMTLAKVTGVSVKDASGSYATVKWTGLPTAGEDGYEIYRATSKNGKYTKVAEVYQKTKKYPSKKVKAKKGKTYWYKVRTFSRWDGEHYLYGPWSNKVKHTR